MARLPGLESLANLAAKPVGAFGNIASRPAVLRPLDMLRGTGSLEKAVAGKVIVITGASSGIGEETALQIGQAGGTVVLLARGKENLDKVAERIRAAGGVADPRQCDLSDFDAIDRVAADILQTYGSVDVLINNAGRSIRRSVALSYDRFHDYERTMQLNYFAAVRLILRFLPGMREQQSGQVINISSYGVQTKVPRFGAYIASKAALDTLCDSLQAEVHDEGVRFTTIHMPLVRTPMIAPTKLYDRFPALTPEDAGHLVAQAIVHRSRRMGPPFGSLAGLADSFSPSIMDEIRNRGYKMFPDSTAAKAGAEATETDAKDGVTAAQEAFAHLTRGTHW
ncbi:SDR family NAD(P)-dependent oxidoreductase [Paraconexibacter antarcticus]|uniref:SDR family NAD(P)-dependent oxidoreductase n=1 Tax=Paraconexibacter antarcticus TaxID=2949664 RepID=A0ABY5DS39_9ACTN|nr:SDR family NAD(P)-dependent oxidoreductase [Paraconexibacter antarcticus]UTI63552.1 SDR family NAD(P)-dependent oxidoreductase [Paraconexibacter antarcticus]